MNAEKLYKHFLAITVFFFAYKFFYNFQKQLFYEKKFYGNLFDYFSQK